MIKIIKNDLYISYSFLNLIVKEQGPENPKNQKALGSQVKAVSCRKQSNEAASFELQSSRNYFPFTWTERDNIMKKRRQVKDLQWQKFFKFQNSK